MALALNLAAPLPPPMTPTMTAGQALDFTAVYEDHFAFVWRSVRRLGVPQRYLDDAVQDVFIVVHRRLDGFEGRASLKSWLFAIARRVAHDHRRRVSRKEQNETFEDSMADNRTATPLEQAANAEAAEILRQFLASLDDDKRDAFVLAELEQMTVPEIAAATSANANTVYSRLRAARQAFDQVVARHQARERRMVR
jgi:RNA polymerase sigma-70 factor (ECF subfamily)